MYGTSITPTNSGSLWSSRYLGPVAVHKNVCLKDANFEENINRELRYVLKGWNEKPCALVLKSVITHARSEALKERAQTLLDQYYPDWVPGKRRKK